MRKKIVTLRATLPVYLKEKKPQKTTKEESKSSSLDQSQQLIGLIGCTETFLCVYVTFIKHYWTATSIWDGKFFS